MTGRTQVELGERWNLFSALVHNRFMAPLHDFLHHDLKSITVRAGGGEREGRKRAMCSNKDDLRA
jgi:hypothetical protein